MPYKKKDEYDIPVSIRGLDRELYTQARIDAVRNHKTTGTWFNEAIREKLERDGKKGGGK